MLKVSAFYLGKPKSFIPRKIFFWPLSISKQKSYVYWLNFLGRFWPSRLCHCTKLRRAEILYGDNLEAFLLLKCRTVMSQAMNKIIQLIFILRSLILQRNTSALVARGKFCKHFICFLEELRKRKLLLKLSDL